MKQGGLSQHAVLKLGISLKSNNADLRSHHDFSVFCSVWIMPLRRSVAPSRVDEAPHNGSDCAKQENGGGTGLNGKAWSAFVGGF